MAQTKSVPRSKLPNAIYRVPVTISLLVEARGCTSEELAQDAKVEAQKWADKIRATVTVGEPVEFR